MSVRGTVKNDYIGFTYGNKHSSELGIVRVSDGSRFNENLLPTIQDKTVQVPGGDGMYYFGSYYTQKQFTVNFAFEDLTEQEVAELKRWLGDKQIKDLIFDECPYKIYSAKVTGTATIKHIPFNEGSTHRVYKGEGSIQFTCYSPFARCVFSNAQINAAKNTYSATSHTNIHGTWEKAWKEALRSTYSNIDEWWDAARFEPNKNFGDAPVSFIADNISGTKDINLGGTLHVGWSLPSGVTATLDTKLGIIYDSDNVIYNQYLTGDSTLKIPVGKSTSAYQDLNYTCLYF